MTNEKQDIINRVDEIVSRKGTEKKAVIPILQAIQDEFNYLP